MIITPFGDPNCHGTLAGSVIYQRRRGQVFCRKYATPNNPNSTAQQQQRNNFSAAVVLWNSLSQAQKDTWNLKATGQVYTGYNLFIRNYLLKPPPSTTPLIYSQLNLLHIDFVHSPQLYGWRYSIRSYPGLINHAEIHDNQNVPTYFTNPLPSPSTVRILIMKLAVNVNIQKYDTLTYSNNVFPSLKLYLPQITGAGGVYLYPADDGSTYYDPGLTSLACEAL